jgi:hypothetical protein
MRTDMQDSTPPTTETTAEHSEPAGIWKKWGHLIVLGSFIGLYMIGFKFWATYQGDLAVVPVYRNYLDHLVSHSPKAKAYEDTYFREQGRDTVASRHFEHLCAVMTGLAVEDGFQLADYPDIPAPWCHERSAYFSEFLQPR